MKKKIAIIAVILIVVIVVALGLGLLNKRIPTAIGEGWLNVSGKYEQDGIYYLVIPTAGYGNQPMEIAKEIYDQVICSEQVLYHIKYAYYDTSGDAEILLFDLDDKLDNR